MANFLKNDCQAQKTPMSAASANHIGDTTMTTEKQKATNQANAQKSTGPRSKEGKALSRYNALSHGLTGEVILLPGEHPEAYEQLRKEFFDEFAPGSRYEKELVERLVSIAWRLRRIPNFEAALLGAAGNRHGVDSVPKSVRTQVWLGRAVHDILDQDCLEKLSRYERRLMRQLKQTLAELEELWNQPHPKAQTPAITIDHDET